MLFLNPSEESKDQIANASKKRTMNQREAAYYRVTDPQKESQYWALANQIHSHDQRAKIKVSRAELSGKMKSKLDIYRVLSTEGQLYLPPYNEVTMDFLSDIIQGKKKVSFKISLWSMGLFIHYSFYAAILSCLSLDNSIRGCILLDYTQYTPVQHLR